MLRLPGDDDYLAAMEDEAHDRFLQVALTCAGCGMLYDHGYHPATRFEPAWAERTECPNCGSGEINEQQRTSRPSRPT
ncbi:MAG: hypothetical protein JO168_10890 [Solirubrobacterales bacterium]|nr:hypothetical protein [Solirubrobacterales bacterium]